MDDRFNRHSIVMARNYGESDDREWEAVGDGVVTGTWSILPLSHPSCTIEFFLSCPSRVGHGAGFGHAHVDSDGLRVTQASTSQTPLPRPKKAWFVEPSDDPQDFEEQVNSALETPSAKRKGVSSGRNTTVTRVTMAREPKKRERQDRRWW